MGTTGGAPPTESLFKIEPEVDSSDARAEGANEAMRSTNKIV